MNKNTTMVVIVLLILAALAVWFFAKPSVPQEAHNAISTSESTTTGMVNDNTIKVSSIKNGDLVQSPLVVEGEVRGGWFFEASFPVRLLDANGKELASVPAQTQADWMTSDFVPFKATLTFMTPGTTTGTLVFQKDNPSDLPQNDDSRTITVRFK